MFWCQIYTRNESQHLNPWFKDNQRYCYDNIFADLFLQGGDVQRVFGPLQFFDLFTWNGWMSALLMALLREFGEELVWNLIVATAMYVYLFVMNPNGANSKVSSLTPGGMCAARDMTVSLFGIPGTEISLCFFKV